MGYATAKHFDPRLIPVIDIAPLRDGTDPIGVSKSLHEASQNTGFIYIKGHGMSNITIDNARATALRFFRSNETDKSLVSVTDKHRGWLGPVDRHVPYCRRLACLVSAHGPRAHDSMI